MDACKDRKFSAIDFKTKPTAGEIQIVLTITTDCRFFLGCVSINSLNSIDCKFVFKINLLCTSHWCKLRPYQEQFPNESNCSN